MIDTDNYEGHTPAPWKASHDRLEHGWVVNSYGWRVYVGEHEKRAEIQNYAFDHDELSEADAQLIADAPLLLEEVKRCHEVISSSSTLQIMERLIDVSAKRLDYIRRLQEENARLKEALQ